MRSHRALIHRLLPASLLLLASIYAAAEPQAVPRGKAGPGYSGMYSFLRDGEFVQINIEAGEKVTGFVSRFGDTESDRGVFLDHFFKQASLNSNQLSFTTETVHGTAYEFHGTIERGEGKNPGDEAYYVLKGTLIENSMDDTKKTSSKSREVVFKMFPQDLGMGQDNKK